MTKQAMIARMLQRPQGVTRRELLDALGWKAISVQADARQCGLILRTKKQNGVMVYFGSKPSIVVRVNQSAFRRAS
jgi:Protein of unknown function (DUF3489)